MLLASEDIKQKQNEPKQRVRGRTAQLSDISSGATCVADLDSRALALTKEASGNSREGWEVGFFFFFFFFSRGAIPH